MKIRVAVIYGGRSGEHEISLRSAKSIMKAMDRAKYEISEYFINKEGKWQPRPILPEPGAHPEIDVVFPVLHGTFGEDGTVQGLLELADLPYVGAGVLASSLSMDKEMMKRVCHERGLPVVEYVTLSRGALDTAEITSRLPFPVFVKPANLGSSVGISKAHDREELEKAVALAAQFDRKIIVERGIQRARIRVLGARQRAAGGIAAVRESCRRANSTITKTSICSIRRNSNFRPKLRPKQDRPSCGAWRWNVTARWSAKAWRASISCWKAPPGNCTSTRSIPFPDSLRSACIRRCGSRRGCRIRKLIDRLIELALERHAARRPPDSRARIKASSMSISF